MEPSSSDREKSLTPLPFPSGFSISFLYCTPQRVSFQYVFLIVYLVLRVDGDVEHYLIHQCNSKYVLADAYEFGSLEDLVSCFRDELFYGKTKLRYPVTPQLVERFCLVREERINKRNKLATEPKRDWDLLQTVVCIILSLQVDLSTCDSEQYCDVSMIGQIFVLFVHMQWS